MGDIVTAEEEMLAVLNRELYYTALKQLFATAAVISLENTLLELLPLGFNDLMHGYFRTLCVGIRPLRHRQYRYADPAVFYRLSWCSAGLRGICSCGSGGNGHLAFL